MRQSSYYLATTLSCLVAATSIRSGNAFQSSSGIGGPRLLSSDQRTFDRHVFALHQAFRNDDVHILRKQHREPQSKLSAVSIANLDAQQLDDDSSFSIPDLDSVQQVLTTALMITANTVGASALVLPEVAAKPGFAITSGLFAVAYIVNLISGLVLAEVAIKQHESSGDAAPSSFKDLADQNMPSAGVMISCLSMFTNACILAFDFNRAGDLLSFMDHTLGMVGFGAGIAAMIATQSGERVSNIASMTVTLLFCSFFGLLAPNLATISDPIAQALAPGTADTNMMSAISEAFPIIFMTTVYQNVVPTVTKSMDYDRTKSMATIALGSLLPICVYLAWCFVGITGATAGGSLMTVFSVAAIVGSSIGCTLSLSEEVGSFVESSSSSSSSTTTEKSSSTDTPNLLTVATSVGVPLAAAYMFAGGEDFSSALKVVGSYASPVLYGVIPAAMAYSQREKLQVPNIVPGGAVGGLGVASACLVLNEIVSSSLLMF